jgi:hypothetical protein
MDEHLAALERSWEQETDRVLVRPIPDFLRSVADRSRHDGNGADTSTRQPVVDEARPRSKST